MAKTPEVAFVAGATGYTGRAVVRALLHAGVATVAHVRPDSASLPRWQTDFGGLGATVDATPWTPTAMAATFASRRPTLVFGLLGTTRKRGAQDGGTYETVDYGMTAMLLSACVAASLNPRFVYLSMVGVRAGASRGGYMEARWRFERELIASGVPYTIARPSFITGPDREESRLGERVASTATNGLLGLASALGGGKLRDLYSSTSAEILGAALVRLSLDPAAANTVAEGAALRSPATRS